MMGGCRQRPSIHPRLLWCGSWNGEIGKEGGWADEQSWVGVKGCLFH